MSEVEKPTEGKIRERLHLMLSTSGSFQGMNVCGIGNYPHEIDFLRLMSSGYVHAYEIKCSIPDLKAENKKDVHLDLSDGICRRSYSKDYQFPIENRAGDPYIQEGDKYHRCRYKHPVRTYTVVVPSQAMVDVALKTLPPWAGILYIGHWEQKHNRVIREPAPLKNSRKMTDKETAAFFRKFYFRYWQIVSKQPCRKQQGIAAKS